MCVWLSSTCLKSSVFCVWQIQCGITSFGQLSLVYLASAVRNRFRYVRISFTVFSLFFFITESRKVASHSRHAFTNKLINVLSSPNTQSVRAIDTSYWSLMQLVREWSKPQNCSQQAVSWTQHVLEDATICEKKLTARYCEHLTLNTVLMRVEAVLFLELTKVL